MQTTAHEIEFIVSTAHSLRVGAHTFEVKPLQVADLPAILRHLKPALLDLVGGSLDAVSLVMAVADYGEALVNCVAVCARAERKLLDAMPPDAFMALALLCAEVNVDFFSRAQALLKASLPNLAPKLAARLAQALPTPQPSPL